MNDEKNNKPLYDYRIEYDITCLPLRLQEKIKELERLSDEGDWFNYDILFDILEIELKGYMRHHKISDYDFKIILRKYGGLYD